MVSSPLFWHMVHFVYCKKKQKPLDSEERMLFGCFQTNFGLTLVVRIIPYNLWLFVLSFTFIRASLDWLESDAPSSRGAPWIVLMSEVLFCHQGGDAAITHLFSVVFSAFWLSSPVSLLTVWWFYFNLSVSFVTLIMRLVIVRAT